MIQVQLCKLCKVLFNCWDWLVVDLYQCFVFHHVEPVKSWVDFAHCCVPANESFYYTESYVTLPSSACVWLKNVFSMKKQPWQFHRLDMTVYPVLSDLFFWRCDPDPVYPATCCKKLFMGKTFNVWCVNCLSLCVCVCACRCTSCSGQRMKECETCKGKKQLLTYIKLKVEWWVLIALSCVSSAE